MGMPKYEQVWSQLGYRLQENLGPKATWSNGDAKIVAHYGHPGRLNEVHYVLPEEATNVTDNNSKPNTFTVPQPKHTLAGEEGSRLLYFEDEEKRDAGYTMLAGKFRDRFRHVERRNAHNTRGIVHWVILDEESWNSEVLDELKRAGFEYGHPMGRSLTLNYLRVLTDSYAV
jgi:hypothetical protein